MADLGSRLVATVIAGLRPIDGLNFRLIRIPTTAVLGGRYDVFPTAIVAINGLLAISLSPVSIGGPTADVKSRCDVASTAGLARCRRQAAQSGLLAGLGRRSKIVATAFTTAGKQPEVG